MTQLTEPSTPVASGFSAASVLDMVDPGGLLDAVAAAGRAALFDPAVVARGVTGLAAGTVSAVTAAVVRAAGGSADGPVELPGSTRYADPAWQRNALCFLLRQEHALLARALAGVTAELDLPPRTRAKVAFLQMHLLAAAEPAHWPLTNPVVLRKALETGGASVLRGARNAVRDLLVDGGPRQVASDRFTIGTDLAATPGSVVFRNRLIELIQYAPQTGRVHAVPMLFSPPWINKYYVMDLAPGRSLVERAVRSGHSVFMISYRNPGAELAGLTLSDYLAEGPLAALDVVADITGAERVDLVALCLGGTLAAATAAWCAARGAQRVHSLTLLNTLLDYTDPGMLGVFTDADAVDRLDRAMHATGYLPGTRMKATFDALRPAELVWGPIVSGWLLGEDPPAFDLLAWNADSTRMPATMHAEYLRELYVGNRLAAGTLTLGGRRLDLGAVRVPAYVVSAEGDHIAPWTSVHAGARLLGGPVRFVLSNSGHIAGVVNPPSPRSRHRVGDAPLPADPQVWRAEAAERPTTWWDDWTPWVAARAGELREPPPMGSARHPVLDTAPGRYVRES
ncbi:PHA/PHB synthase family protein [Pseudonocardia sp. CA-107938]|uniref:PHA/PHB synthase family protein n=1 Tax=Pseudonocardia sp. CA-107938 TaxID=3240021 RepID=UPI003D8FA3E6